ncbi:hypothetical protein I543_3937 [Mycobacteroides abscessus 21]|uniref:Uncharacterized protein n=1 Tax=Mycobacteroides abscessus 21 TaxID=1299324 RepID=A0A829QA32_9MYCO|nr:hypothetical protein I543_3937 [Mycobacteroides abscessus 21]
MGLREFSEIFTKRCPPIAVDRRRWTNSLHWMPTRCSRSCPISTVLTSRMPRPRCVRRQSWPDARWVCGGPMRQSPRYGWSGRVRPGPPTSCCCTGCVIC